MNYSEEQVKEFLDKNNKDWNDLIDQKYVTESTFVGLRDMKLKGVKPSLEIPTDKLLLNPLKAFIQALTKQRNLWTKINHNTESEEEREMALVISNRYDRILKVLRNQLNLSKRAVLTVSEEEVK